MTVELVNRSGALVPETQMRTLIDFGIEYMELNPECEISLTFVDPQEMEELHIKWMDEPGPTDVLSFPMDLPESKGEVVTLGDIVIAPAVAAAQAQSAGHSVEEEIYILATHGLLHILGYDHADPDEEKVMFALQEKIVKEWSLTVTK
ncbi:probable rRNA maturation factor [Candidatus Planktophila dulcis]|uniref:rRNA maturation RNase YbeY n=1 Tax=Candidatus Planktophila dulcis TaxID=1884914 RepID=UPI000BAC608A|nr:rRNA maturation RNase YbeY [Candidatus Planktophila dulcis]ASY14372.1 probable rRNA maturation factor [Candidatus Planktophila dulcis]